MWHVLITPKRTHLQVGSVKKESAVPGEPTTENVLDEDPQEN